MIIHNLKVKKDINMLKLTSSKQKEEKYSSCLPPTVFGKRCWHRMEESVEHVGPLPVDELIT